MLLTRSVDARPLDRARSSCCLRRCCALELSPHPQDRPAGGRVRRPSSTSRSNDSRFCAFVLIKRGRPIRRPIVALTLAYGLPSIGRLPSLAMTARRREVVPMQGPRRFGRLLALLAFVSILTQVAGPSAHAAGLTQTRDSDCGPDGLGSVDPSRAKAGCRCPVTPSI
jgi:hypothetical protein